MQWDPDAAGVGQGRFLINNITTKGETSSFTLEQFEQGQINVNLQGVGGSIQDPRVIRYRVNIDFPVISADLP